MKWGYAELSKMAKDAGGPEALLELIEQSGKNKMIPVVIVVGLLGGAAGVGIEKFRVWFRKKKNADEQVIEAAKQEIIDGIKEYDMEHGDANISQEVTHE